MRRCDGLVFLTCQEETGVQVVVHTWQGNMKREVIVLLNRKIVQVCPQSASLLKAAAAAAAVPCWVLSIAKDQHHNHSHV